MGKLGASFDTRAYYLLSRASALGLYAPASPPRRPGALPAALSYYPILIALMEGVDPSAGQGLDPASLAEGHAPAAGARDGTKNYSEAGAFMAGMVEYGLGDELSRLPQVIADAAGPSELRALARMDMERGELAEAVRLYGRLSSRRGFSPEPEDIEILYPIGFRPEMEAACAESGLPLDLLCALVRTESFFDPGAGSTAGARGLAQLMPGTAKAVASQLGIASPDLSDPATNLRLGARYLADLVKRFGGDLLMALMSYNGGPTRVVKASKDSPGLPADLFLETVPMDESREYGRKVLAARAVYGYLIGARDFSGTVEDFLPGFPSR
jgi:soluble lytic murein transglycosylase